MIPLAYLPQERPAATDTSEDGSMAKRDTRIALHLKKHSVGRLSGGSMPAIPVTIQHVFETTTLGSMLSVASSILALATSGSERLSRTLTTEPIKGALHLAIGMARELTQKQSLENGILRQSSPRLLSEPSALFMPKAVSRTKTSHSSTV